MARGKQQVKKVTLDIRRKKDAKKLAKLLEDGWVIVSQHKRSLLQWKPGWIDYVLTREG